MDGPEMPESSIRGYLFKCRYNDWMFIEAHITAEDFIFARNNTREVARVEAVEVEDWTKKEQRNWISVKIVK